MTVQHAPLDIADAELQETERQEREAHYYRLFAGALCVAACAFGLLNLWGVIHI